MLNNFKIAYAVIFTFFIVLVLPISGIAQQTAPQVERELCDGELQGLRDANRSKQSLLDTQQERIAVLEGENSTCVAGSTTLTERVDAANAEAGSLREQLTAANAETGTLRAQLTAANAETGSLREQLTAANAETGTLRNQLTAANAETASLRDQLTAASAETGSLRDQLTAANVAPEDYNHRLSGGDPRPSANLSYPCIEWECWLGRARTGKQCYTGTIRQCQR